MPATRSISEREVSKGARAAALLTALEENGPRLERRAFVGVHASHAKDGDAEAAREWRFRIGRERHELRPPIDWSEQPYEVGDEHAFRLNCFFFADPVVLASVDEDFRVSLLESLWALYQDWIEQNPQDDPPRPHK
jgi:hypothetical protein